MIKLNDNIVFIRFDRALPGTLMWAFLRVEAAGMTTIFDEKSVGQWSPNLYLLFIKRPIRVLQLVG